MSWEKLTRLSIPNVAMLGLIRALAVSRTYKIELNKNVAPASIEHASENCM
jgi:hypothetical protein